MATFLSSIKNFTLDCTRYYDKLFTYSELKHFFFLKAANRHYFDFSKNTQPIPAKDLGTCQKTYCISETV